MRRDRAKARCEFAKVRLRNKSCQSYQLELDMRARARERKAYVRIMRGMRYKQGRILQKEDNLSSKSQ